MNLKNSKFLRRIQELRRMSKDKIRKEKERNERLHTALTNCFEERSGITNTRSKIDDKYQFDSYNLSNKDDIKIRQQHFLGQQCEHVCGDNTNSLIHCDNHCYELPTYNATAYSSSLLNKNHCSSDTFPSITSAKGSICVCHTRYAIVGKIAKILGYKIVKDNKMWNVLWTDSLPGVELYKNMKRFQQINHFPGMIEICRKDLLSRNLNRMLKLYPKDYKIFPKTWVFPADYGEALNYANNRSKPITFILKPDAGAQGRGIWLTTDLKKVSPGERMICQAYISKPLLIDGYKFDFRVYALITSVDPLRVFVYNEGLARFATSKYVEPTSDNRGDLYMHLTNYSVNKRNAQYELCDNDDCGSKRKLSAINTWMRRRNYNVDEFWDKIDDIIIKTILSAWPMLKHNYHACFPSHDKIQACFEILGFDVIVDSKLRPYILEVNHSPSFHTNEVVDRQVKRPLIKDTLNLVSTALADKKQILREDRKRIKQRLLKVRQGNGFHRSSKGSTPVVHINLRNTTDNDTPPDEKELNVKNTKKECPLSALAQQIAWEESHLGDFRRIMPPHDPVKLNYYCQFYGLQNQVSIYAETAASKKREEVSKKLRMELEEKRRKQNEIRNRPGSLKFEERNQKRASISRDVIEKHRKTHLRNQAQWTPGFISTAEERLRGTYMQMRTDLLNEMNIIEIVFTNLYNAGKLTNTDIIKFPEIYNNLKQGYSDFKTTNIAPTNTLQQL